MAERKAVNKYYPPDWDPRKGSVNKRVGQHPLRDRARKLSQGILVIRFELPYNIWCGGCGSHVGMGVRYNAEKSKVGNYYSTPIYKFRMKCHLCDNYFEIQTDPKNHDYVILEGARRKEQRWDPVANEQIVPEDKNVHKKMAMDAMFKLEHGSDDKDKGKGKVKSLAELEASRFSMKEDYLLNRMARDKFRTEKKELKEAAEADQSILDRGALNISLVEETEEDRNLAGLIKYSVTSSYEEKQREKRKLIEQRPLFDIVKPVAIPASSSSYSSSSSTKSVNSNEDSKKKLKETIRLCRKDPFAIAKLNKLSKSSQAQKSLFGIRNSKLTKRKAATSLITRKSVVHHVRNNSSVFKRVNTNKNVNCDSSSVDSVSSVKPYNNTCGGIANKIKSISTVNDNTVPCGIEPNILHGDTVNITNSISDINTNIKENDKERPITCSVENFNIPAHSSVEEVPNVYMSSSATLAESGIQSFNTSGLSLLMNSYDEGNDSDNWSSS